VLAQSKSGTRVAANLRGITAIVIENDLQILEGMIELLQARGMRAIPTVSAEEALEALESIGKVPDLIIADYHLDKGTGVNAIKQLRNICACAIPAIVITADHTSAIESEICNERASLLHKPIRPAQLFDTIDKLSANG
jgi:CheY-like chemotaxis protein